MIKNKKGNVLIGILIALGVIALIALMFAMWIFGSYNSLVAQDTKTAQLWGNVENVYQRQADLIPNLVATVSGAANFEKSTLIAVTDARTKYLGATTVAQKQAAANQMDSALSRLLVTVEAYPQLTATQNFQGLQDELAGSANRITWERTQYNAGAQSYQQTVRSFPSNIIAGMFGFSADKWQTFKASDKAATPPVVNFSS
jgi:LemA protein